jgi:hypothetical protein
MRNIESKLFNYEQFMQRNHSTFSNTAEIAENESRGSNLLRYCGVSLNSDLEIENFAK